MASATTEHDLALRASLLIFLRATTRGMESALDVAGAITATLVTVRNIIADFSTESNRTRTPVLWGRLPPELQLEIARWLPPGPRARMLGVSRDIRKLLLSDTSLWTSIAHPQYLRPYANHEDFFHVMLSRAGSRPLDRLEWKNRCARESCPDPVRDIVLSTIPRVRKLSLNETYFEPRREGFWTVATPLLTDLTITTGDYLHTTMTISKALWTGKKMPHLQSLRVDAICFEGLPDEPLASVTHLEAAVWFETAGQNWTHIWAWFPRLESLVVWLYHSLELSVPSPPETLRHVILRVSKGCKAPERFVQQWDAHGVKLLEIFSNSDNTLSWAIDFLAQSEPNSQWTASFTRPCCETRESWGMAAVRGKSVTVVVRPERIHDVSALIYAERARGILVDRLETLHLGSVAIGAMFGNGLELPRLRALTISRTDTQIPLRHMVYAPELERLTVDLSHEVQSPTVALSLIPHFVKSVEHAQRLQVITVRLPGKFDRQSPALAKVSEKLAPAAHQVRVEYEAPTVCGHEFPCISHQPSGH